MVGILPFCTKEIGWLRILPIWQSTLRNTLNNLKNVNKHKGVFAVVAEGIVHIPTNTNQSCTE